jgi:hypothetical protein
LTPRNLGLRLNDRGNQLRGQAQVRVCGGEGIRNRRRCQVPGAGSWEVFCGKERLRFGENKAIEILKRII